MSQQLRLFYFPRFFNKPTVAILYHRIMPSPLLNILFLGSDQFSIGTLQPLLHAERLWSSLRVVTAGEKDVGRGGKARRRMAREFKKAACRALLTLNSASA
jgi:hypothetical protein